MAPSTTTTPSTSACADVWAALKCSNRIASGGERFCTLWAGGLNCEVSCRATNPAWVHRDTTCTTDGDGDGGDGDDDDDQAAPSCAAGPLVVEGYFPLFATQACAERADANGVAHSHGLSGTNWWMPSSGIEGVDVSLSEDF